MASNDFMKLKGAGDVKAQFRHSEKESRKKQNHSNKDINLSVTDENISFENLDYQGLCDKYDKRMEYLDSLTNQNKRKDRVTCFGVETPCPEELPEHQEDAWFKRVYEIECNMFGKDNVIDGIVHKDEKHAYIHAETGKECVSRTHLHVYVIPEVDGKLNGKVFSSKARMIQLNNEIQKMSETEFGVRFMDGSQKKSTKSVEKLKNESIEALHRKEKVVEARAQRQWDKELKLDERELSISSKEKELNERETRLEAQESVLDEKAIKLSKREKEIEIKASEVEKQRLQNEAARQDLLPQAWVQIQIKKLQKYADEHPSKQNFRESLNKVMVTSNKLSERENRQQTERSENLFP